jgi:hypothetical protein
MGEGCAIPGSQKRGPGHSRRGLTSSSRPGPPASSRGHGSIDAIHEEHGFGMSYNEKRNFPIGDNPTGTLDCWRLEEACRPEPLVNADGGPGRLAFRGGKCQGDILYAHTIRIRARPSTRRGIRRHWTWILQFL